MATQSLPEAVAAMTAKAQQVLDAAQAIAAQAAKKTDLAAASGAESIGFSALLTSSSKMGQVRSLTDFPDSKGAVHGNGSRDDYSMIMRALDAYQGKGIYVPDPILSYANRTGKIVIPPNTTLHAFGRHTTAYSHEFNGDMFEMSDGASIINANIIGNGATYSGGCFVYSGTNGRQRVSGVKAQGWDGPVQSYSKDAGSQCHNDDIRFSRINAGTGTGRHAIVIAPEAVLGAVPRKFLGLETDGTCSIDFGGCNNVYVTAGFIGDLKYTDDTRAALVYATRLANQLALDMKGHNNVLQGDISPQITLTSGTDNCHVAGSFNRLPVIDNSGNNRNTITHWQIAYSCVLGSGGTAPSIGNGSIVATYSRTGSGFKAVININIGSTTNLGTGGLTVSLPQQRFSGLIFVGGTVVASRSGATAQMGFAQVAGNVAVASLFIHGSGPLTSSSLGAFAAGDNIRVTIDCDN